MAKLFFAALIVTAFSLASAAQTRTRVFDNFDTSTGVQIVTPTVKPVVEEKKPASKNKKTVRKTSQTMSVGDGLGARAYTKTVMGTGRSLNGFTTGNPEIDSYIEESSRRYRIDPLLIYAQMHQESSFKVRATSYKGASGLMQLMPATARRFGVTKIYDPKQNIEAGVKYMRWLLDTFNGDLVLALAGYNAGEGAVMKYGWNVPPYRETQEYVRRITARYNMISNPSYVRSVKKIPSKNVAKLEDKVPAPLTIYEPNPLVVRTSDGRVRLVNQ
jgi:hypothetical protein